MRRPRLTIALVLGLAIAGAAASALADAHGLAEQTSRNRGVIVRVKPVDVAPGAKSWAFEVVLETHSVDLTDDLPRAATLAGAGGAAQAASAWEGDPPGGHHRKGVLRFAPIAPPPDELVLQIRRPGESAPRSFRWALK
jgi:hypothetical protein